MPTNKVELFGWTMTLIEKGGRRWYEIKKDGILIIVANGKGYDHKFYTADPDRFGRTTMGVDIHLSMNGPKQLSFDDWSRIDTLIAGAKAKLKQLDWQDRPRPAKENSNA